MIDRVGRCELAPPRDVGGVAERADHGDARALVGLGQLVGDDGDLDAEQRRGDRRAEQRLVALVVGMGDEGDARRQQLGPGGLDEDLLAGAVRPGEAVAVVGAGLLLVLELGLADRHLEGDVPDRRRLGAVRLAPGEVAEERPLADPAGALADRGVGHDPSRRRGRPGARGPRRPSRPARSAPCTARRSWAGSTGPCVFGSGLAGGSKSGSYGQRRVAADAVEVLDPALGGHAVVVPAHRVEDLLAPHALVAGEGVGLDVAEDRAHVERPETVGGGVSMENTSARGLVRSKRYVPSASQRGGVDGFDAVEGRLVGDPGGPRRPGYLRVSALRRNPRLAFAAVIRLHDTATGEVRELALREPGKVSMYVCGPTVYGLPHLGHGRFTLVFDVLRRYLEWTASRSATSPTSPTSTTRSSRKADRGGVAAEDVTARYEEIWWHGHGRPRRRSVPTTTPTPRPTSSRWSS